MTLLAACGSQPGPQEAAAPNTNTNATTNNGANEESEDDPNNLTYEELIEKAKEEGELVMYGTDSAELMAKVSEAFQNEFGIKINYSRVSGTGEVVSRIESEHQSGKVMVDILNNGNDSILRQFVDKGYAKQVKFTIPETAEEANSITDGYIFTSRINPTGIVYDSARMEEPTSWEDLLAPELKGQVAMADPSLITTKIALFVELREKFGNEFIQKLGEQLVIYNEDPMVPNNVIGKEIIAGISYSAVSVPFIKGDSSIKYTDNLDVITGPMLPHIVFAKAPHPHAALLYANWIYSKEGQQLLNGNDVGISPLNSIEIEGVRPFPQGFKQADYDRAVVERDAILELFNSRR